MAVEAVPIAITFIYPRQRSRCVYYVFVLAAIIIVQNVMKLSYADPRPYWVYPDVQALSCSGSFGNPSGHSETAMAVAMMLWFEYSATDASFLNKAGLLILALAYACSVGYSRLFLGVHSLDQIVYGFSLGFWIAATFHFVFRDDLYEHLVNMFAKKYTQFVGFTVINTVLAIVIIAGQVINYAVMSQRITMDPYWQTNIV